MVANNAAPFLPSRPRVALGTASSRPLTKGNPVVAAAVLLRSVAIDAAYVSNVVEDIEGPVILAGHSYGGQVLTTAA